MGLFGKSKKEEAVTWTDRANALIDIGSYEDAITCCDKALKIDPDNAKALFYNSYALQMLGRYEDAIKYLEKLSKIKPNDVSTLINLGGALNNLGRHKDALICTNKALKSDPDNAKALFCKGRIFHKLGRSEDAIKYIKMALKIDPVNNPGAWVELGIVLGDLGRHKDALSCANEALKFWYGLTGLSDPTFDEALRLKEYAEKKLKGS